MSERLSEVPVSVRELVVLDGSGVVTDSLKVLGIAEVSSPHIDAVTRLSKPYSLIPCTQRLCRQRQTLPKIRCQFGMLLMLIWHAVNVNVKFACCSC